VVLSLLVGAVAVGAVLLQVHHDRRVPEALAAGQSYPTLRPPWTDPLGMTRIARISRPVSQTSPRGSAPQNEKPSQAQRSTPTRSRTPPQTTKHAPASRIWLYVLAGILLFVLALAARLLLVRLAWRRLRRRLGAGSPAERVTGAWAWMRIRLEAYRLPLGASLSPDLVAAGRPAGDLPEEAVGPLQALAAAATTAAFAGDRSLADDDVAAAWTAAGRTEASVRSVRSRWARAGFALRGPALKVRPQ
jgi:hypothetical protein